MKKIYFLFFSLALVLGGCQKKYELNSEFTVPTRLDAPEQVILSPSSGERVNFYWSGGAAEDGGVILYKVLFDRAGADFSAPVAVFPSNNGSQARLTLSHAQLNALARKSGIKPRESGDFIWTVTAAKGGSERRCAVSKALKITRPDGVDAPESLAVAGTAALEAGQSLRKVSDGVFSIVTRLQAGNLYFTDGQTRYYQDESGAITSGEGAYTLPAVPEGGIARITADFNSLKMKMETIENPVLAQWAATGATIAELEYQGGGVFSGTGDVMFYGPGRPGTPSWCTFEECRYAFTTRIDGTQVRWGSKFSGESDAQAPDGSKDFYDIHEVPVSSWRNLWKMASEFDLKTVTITLYTNKDDTFTHTIEEAADPGGDTLPETLALYGPGAEVQGQPFLKISKGIFRIYTRLNGQAVSFMSEGKSYGERTPEATPNPGDTAATRLTVNLKTGTVTTETVNKVRVIWGETFHDIAPLTYQGQGVWEGSGQVHFAPRAGYEEDRYYFIPTLDGAQTLCWGRLDSVDPEGRPDGGQTADYFDCGEYAWSQWLHLWKFATAADGHTCKITLLTNSNGVMTHRVTVE